MSTVLLLSVVAMAADYGTAPERRQSREEAFARNTMNKWLDNREPREIAFHHPGRYPDTAELIEQFVHRKTKRGYEVTEIAYLLDNHTPEFVYGRVFRAKIKASDGKEHVVDFLLQQRSSAYLEVVAWQRARELPEAVAESEAEGMAE